MRHRNDVIKFEDGHIFMHLNPKIVFEKTQMTCS